MQPNRQQPFSVKISYLVIFTTLFIQLLAVVRPQNVENNEQQRFFGVTDAELPRHCTNFLFGKMNDSQRDLLYWRITSFLLTKAIRKKWTEICDAEMAARKAAVKGQGSVKQRARNERGKKTVVATSRAEWTKEQLEGFKKLAEDELNGYLKEDLVDRQETVERIAEIWVIFKYGGSEKLSMVSDEHQKTQKATKTSAELMRRKELLWTEIQALNMEAMKPLLLVGGKKAVTNTNELSMAFEKRYFWEHETEAISFAKMTLRRMVGERMFEELELQEPVLLRLDMIENTRLLQLYKQLFTSALIPMQPLLQLEISSVFADILKLTHYLIHGSDKLVKEVQNYWDRNVARLCAAGGEIGKGSAEKMLEKVLKKLKEWFTILVERINSTITDKANKYPNIEKSIIVDHVKVLGRIYRVENSPFRQFLNETPGARARVYKFMGPNTPTVLMHFDVDESAMLDQLATNYAVSVSAKSELKRLKAHLTADLLVQLHWLDQHFHSDTKEWDSCFKDMFLLFVDNFVDCNEQHMQLYGTTYNNMLFGMIQAMEAKNHAGILQHWEEFAKIRKKFRDSEFIITEAKLKYAEKQARWLPKEHLKLMKQILARKKGGGIDDVDGDSNRAINRLWSLNSEKVKQLAHLLTGKNAHQQEVEPKAFVELFKKKNQPLMKLREEEAHTKSEKQTCEHVEDDEGEVKQQHFKEMFKEFKEGEEEDTTKQKDITKETLKTEQSVVKHDEVNVPATKETGSVVGLTEDDSKKIVEKYMQLLAEKSSELDRLKAHIAVDVMVQLHWLDNKFAREQLVPKNQLISFMDHAGLVYAKWTMARDQFMIFLQQIEENDRQDFVQNFSILFNNLLFNLVKGKMPFLELMRALDGMVEIKNIKLANIEPVGHVNLLDEENRAKWMANQHREILERLRMEGRIRDLNHTELEHLATFLRIEPNNEKELALLREIFGNEKESKVEKKEIEEVEAVEVIDVKRMREPTDEAMKRKGKAHIVEVEEEKEEKKVKQKHASDHDDNDNEWNKTDVLLNKLVKHYLQLISQNSTEQQRFMAKTAANVLVQLLWLNKFFNYQAILGVLNSDWAIYRKSFVQFLRQLEAGDGDRDWVEKSAVLYGNIFHKLRWQNGNERWEDLLKPELDQLEQCKQCEGKGKALPTVELIEANIQAEWLRNEHERKIRFLSEDHSRDSGHNFCALKPTAVESLAKMFGAKIGEERKADATKAVEEKIVDDKIVDKKVKEHEGENMTTDSLEDSNDDTNEDYGNGELDDDIFRVEPFHHVLLKCPKQGETSVSSSHNEPYVPFLFEGDKYFWRRDADIGALTCMFMKAMSRVLLAAKALLERGVEEELVKVESDWEQLATNEIQTKEEVHQRKMGVENVGGKQMALKERTLCRYHAFFWQRILDNKVLAEYGGQLWKTVLNRAGFTEEMVSFLKLPGLTLELSSCTIPEHAAAVVTRLVDYPGRSYAHFVYLNARIQKSKRFRRFLCTNVSVQHMKDRLLELLDEEMLAALEILHPDILKIEEMHPKVRIYLYREFMKHQRDTVEALEAELRIVVPLFVNLVKQFEHEHRFKDKALGQPVREKARWLRLEIFRDHNVLLSLGSVCLMEIFIVFAHSFQASDHSSEKSKKSLKGESKGKESKNTKSKEIKKGYVFNGQEAADEVRQWDGAECEQEQQQFSMYFKQRQRFQTSHHEFIKKHLEQICLKANELGMRVRLKYLVPNLELTYDWEYYTHVDKLQNQLKKSLFTDNEEEHLASLLAVRFIIWALFMDAHLKKRSAELAAVEGKVWHDNRAKLLENKLDRLLNLSSDHLKAAERVQAKMQVGFCKLFLVKQKSKASFKKKSVEVLRELRKCKEKMFTELRENTCAQWNELWNWDEYNMQYFDWAHGIAGEALQRLLKPGRTDNGGAFGLDVRLNYSESFRAELKQGFIDHPVAKKRLPKLVGLLGVERLALALDLKDWKPGDLGLIELPMKEDERDDLKISEVSSSKARHSTNNEEEAEMNLASSESKASAISSASTATGPKTASKSSKKKRNKVKKNSSQTSEANAAMDAEPSPIARHLDPLMPKTGVTKPKEAEFSEPMSPNYRSNPTFETKTHSKGSKNKKKDKGNKTNYSSLSATKHPEPAVTSEHPAVLEATDFLESADETQESLKEPGNKASPPVMEAKEEAIFQHDKNNRFAALDGNFPDKMIVPDSRLQPGWKLPKESRKSQQQAKAREIVGQNEAEITRGSGKNLDQKPLEISRKSHSNKSSMPETNNTRERMDLGMATKASGSNPYSLKQAALTTSKPSKPVITRRIEQAKALETAKLVGGNKQFDQFVKPSGPSPVQSKLQQYEQREKQQQDSLEKIEDSSSRSRAEKTSESEKPDTSADELEPQTDIESSKTIPQRIAQGKQTTASASIRTSSPQEMAAFLLRTNLKKLKKEEAEKQPKLLESAPVQPIDPIESLREVLLEKGYLESAVVELPPPAITFGTIEPKVTAVKLTPQQAVEKLKTVLKLWTHLDQLRDPILLSFGSYLLDLHTADSDMDCIVLLPIEKSKADDWRILYREKFFGNKIIPDSKEDEVVLCELNSRSRHCPNWSLYCMLCWDENVSELHKLNGRNKIPMITMKFHDFDFDLLFVTMPTTITNKLIADEWKSTDRPFEEAAMLRQLLTSLSFVDKMIGAFIDDWKNIHNADVRKGMLFALSGYRANLLIKGLLEQRSKETFKMAYLALKLWTKKHFIYGGKFGLLNGTTLTMMLLNVFLKHSDDSVADILSQFFKTYSNWEWPEPVKLDEEISKRAIETTSNYSSLDWKRENEEKAREHHFRIYEYLNEASDPYLADHAKLVWPVILPGFPTQNAAFNVNAWTKQAIQRELERGVTETDKLRRQIQAASSSEMIRQEWGQWLEGENFNQKYEHFVAIICAAQSIERMRSFCDYAEIRIRLQLLFSFGDISKIVQWMHANPERVRTQKEGGCPPGEEAHLPAGNGNWFCTIWLVGVQMVQEKEQQNIEHVLEEKLEKLDFIERKMEKRSRREDFSHKIFKSFKRQESFTSSPRKISSSIQQSSATSAESSATPNAASYIPQIIDITELREKIWTKYLTRETLKTWLPTGVPPDNDG